MAGKIDRAGTFQGIVSESTLGQSTSGYPQWVARLTATHYYVNDKPTMEHYGITEPGYVDWPGEDSLLAYLVLFTDKGPMKNNEQVMALGWKGDDFQTLQELTGKRLLFRVEERTFKEQTKLEVTWVDTEDAPPERSLKNLDADKAKALNAQFLAGFKKPTAPAKPVAAKASVPAGNPAAPAATHSQSTSPAVATPAAPAVAQSAPADPKPAGAAASQPASASPAAAAPTAAKVPTGKKGAKAPPPAAAPQAAEPTLPTATTKAAAWEYVNEPAVLGDSDPSVVTDAWIASCAEVLGNRTEEESTPEDWAQIRDLILKDMGVKA